MWSHLLYITTKKRLNRRGPPTDHPPPPIPEKSQSACFLTKNRNCEHFSHKPIFSCFRNRVLKVSGANSKLDIFPGLRQKNASGDHTVQRQGAIYTIYRQTTTYERHKTRVRQTAKNGVLIPPKRGCNIINLRIFNFGGSNFKRNIFGEKVVQTYTLDFISLKV